MTKASVLRHFNLNCQVILEINISDLVISEILSQYNDKDVLHSVTFYNKSIISVKCNYHIYDKKLLVIICCFEHWCLKLKHTDLFIQVITDHQTLKTFIKNKKLTHWQIKYLDILSQFNFQVIFQSDKINSKADTLIRISDSEEKNLIYQTILTLNCVKIWVREVKKGLFKQMHTINKTDELCNEYREIIVNNTVKLHSKHLYECWVIDSALFKNNLLWVSESLQTELLQKIHDQSSTDYSDINWTVKLIHCYYYWSEYVITVKQYIQNCCHCQQSKSFCDVINKLLISLSVPQQHWQDIVINFITDLSMSEDYNVICTIIDQLLKERHYISYHLEDQRTSAEKVIKIMLWNIYCLHELPNSIVSDWGSQFVFTLWKSMCKQLKIKTNLSTTYYLETDSQTEWVNQDIEWGLQTYCNYIQNDWARWLLMMKFSDNNNTFSAISLLSFYLNQSFHPCMSFSFDKTTYKSTHKRLQSVKTEDINTHMQKILNFSLKQLKKSWKSMKVQANKHQKNITYEIKDMMWLSDCNIKFTKLCWDLKNKQLRLFCIKKQIEAVYQLKLSAIM